MIRNTRRAARFVAVLAAIAWSTSVSADGPDGDGSTEAPAREAIEAASDRPMITDAPPSDEVTEAPSAPDASHSRGSRRRWTDGPRRIPTPHGAAMERAQRLGLGTRTTATSLLREPPRQEWRRAGAGATPSALRWPVDVGAIGRGFGYVRHERPNVRHNGIDIATPRGMVIRAAADGVVAYADNGISGYGNVVLIVHPNGWVTLYAHQDRITVQPGWRVRRGERIGFVGATGRADGPHLHFELRVEGEPVDPVPHFQGQPWVEGRARLLVLRRNNGGHTYGHLGEIEPDFTADARPSPAPRTSSSRRTATRSTARASTRPAARTETRTAARDEPREPARTDARDEPRATARTETREEPRTTARVEAPPAATADAIPADVVRLLASGPTRTERNALRSHAVTELESPIRLEVNATFANGALRYAAENGTNVRSSAAGRVAYVGRGLRGELTTVVLVHANGWVTVYSGVFDATVAVGSIVGSGERIAILRDSDRGLSLELFAQGRSVDPRTELRAAPRVVATRD